MNVRTVGDAAAYLKLSGGQYANYNENGVLELELDRINANSDVEFSDVFRISNQGTDPVGIFIDEGSASYAFQNGNGPAEAPSEAGSDGMYNVLSNAGFNQAGWYDDDITTGEDINGPKALPSGYRPSPPDGNSANNRTFGTDKDHILAVGQSISPDWYIFDTPADPSDLDITGEIVILAYSKDYVDAGKGP
ncbi:hypothetical protein [Halobaculum marinum]|uniref:Uncharacterized protein n=1 Tax=Halobaculum marinum TaxID=3031996 RepID=A0ABD5WVZ0_9EURY|nr:hypothetical protein [Halobaculum sp. DT55]